VSEPSIFDFIEESEPLKEAGPSTESIKSKIKQRRAQMLIHSCIYYELNDNIISDHKWQEWADELQVLQEQFPECCNIGFYDYNFRDWTGATGNHLPHRDPWVFRKSNQILEMVRSGKYQPGL
jgi:hypothetical protein